jgi:hypothetical protein
MLLDNKNAVIYGAGYTKKAAWFFAREENQPRR